ncbi:MAG TPA: DUF4197 domain-containing protein, partial [Chitinophagales bacterium]|nr:DUF4197 domain-containing protein [Chitinophagales bacterium]
MQKSFFLFFVLVATVVFGWGCSSANQLLKNAEDVLNQQTNGKPVTNSEIIMGLKEALNLGIGKGADIVSKKDGYFKNAAIKIIMPAEAQKAEKTLRDLGFNKLCDNAIESMNRAAEDAAIKAKPIFIDAIKKMTITDALNILKGQNNAATEYLRKTTSNSLTNAFKPVVSASLKKVNATKFWNDAFTEYNKIPMVKKVNPDLEDYVTQRAPDGLFHMIAKEEAKIRKDPLARTTE